MAEGILESVEMLIGKQENLTAITFGKEMGVDELEECFQKEIVDVSEKNQYLILCDLKGGTPFNTASRFSFKNENVAVMYGMNLPLVITASLEASEEGQTLKKLTLPYAINRRKLQMLIIKDRLLNQTLLLMEVSLP